RRTPSPVFNRQPMPSVCQGERMARNSVNRRRMWLGDQRFEPCLRPDRSSLPCREAVHPSAWRGALTRRRTRVNLRTKTVVNMQSPRSVYMPALVNEALSALQTGAIALAGGTWIMRAPLRGQALGASYVSLRGLEGIRAIEFREAEIAIGAAVTHFELAAALKSVPDCAGLAQAAAQAANPAVRRAATSAAICAPLALRRPISSRPCLPPAAKSKSAPLPTSSANPSKLF